MSKAPKNNLHRSVRAPYVKLWRNPMARGWDKGKPLVHVFLLAVWLLLLPVAATIASATADTALNGADQQVEQLTDTDAMVLVAVPPAFGTNGNPVHRRSATLVQWLGDDGRARQAQALVDSATPVGAHTRIPLDPAGDPVLAQSTPLDLASTAVLVVLVCWLWVGVLLGLVGVGLHQIIRRATSRRWATEWASVAAGWTREVR